MKKHLHILWVLAALLLAGSLPTLAQPAGFSDQVFSSGFNTAIGLTFDDNGRMYVSERGGRIFVVDNGIKSPYPLLDISDEVAGWRDFGLLGVVLDPDYLNNGFIYLLYTVDHEHLYNGNANKDVYAQAFGRITRYRVINPTAAADVLSVDLLSRTVLVGETPSTGFPCTHQSHHVGSLAFGTDGTLLAACGDAASYSTVDEGGVISGGWVNEAIADGILSNAENIGAYRSQVDFSLNGKIIRIDPATGDGIPSNPYYNAGSPRSVQSRMWGRGLRNPCRMTLRPGTGSTNPADANPGVLYIGDVGWNKREELNICDGPDMNFGWPWYEGMSLEGGYTNSLYEPGTNGIPAHDNPVFDWRNGRTARVFSGGTIYNMGAGGNPISGSTFNGNCSMGGTWYTGTDFPASYQNSYFHADYGTGWILNFHFDANNNPQSVESFIPNGGNVTAVSTSPVDGGLYYVNRGAVVRKVSYTPDNQPPSAEILADITYGTSPLTVSFRGNRSADPDGDSLSYTWDFRDGTATSTAENPGHTFTASGPGPEKFTVLLVVDDGEGSKSKDSLVISLNNTPPVISSTSIDSKDYYSGTDTVALTAIATDAEDAAQNLTFEWQTFLYHDNHNHPEPILAEDSASTVLSPVGCDGVLYFYRVRLKVTDTGGLSTIYEKDIYPDCPGSGSMPQAKFTFSELSDKPKNILFNGISSYDLDGPIVSYDWDFGDGTTASGAEVSKVYFDEGSYPVSLTVTDNDGNTDATSGIITVFCGSQPGFSALGSIGYEKWDNVSGTSLSAIDFDNDLPDLVNRLTSIQTPLNSDDNYGVRVRGYLHAPQTGTYTIQMTSDDQGEFYISTDDDPANKVLVASVSGWAASTNWTKYGSQTGTVTLTAGNRYYVEGVMKEGGGGDHLFARWTLPDGTVEDPIGSNRISPWNGGPYPNLWLEDFHLKNGFIEDEGATEWSIEGANLGGSAEFDVDGETFKASNTIGEGVWLSEVVDISSEASVDVQLKMRSAGSVDPQDYIRVYYKLNGGAEQLLTERTDNFNGDNWETYTSSAISGNTIQVVVRMQLSANDEDFFLDDIQVVSNGPLLVSDPNACASCATSLASYTALRGQYGSCISNQNNDWLEIQDEYEEALISIHDQNQDLGMVKVETFDHGNELFVYQDFYFIMRSFRIEAETTFASPVSIRLFILPSELDAIVDKDPSVSGLSDLRVVKYSNGKLGQVGFGTAEVITPTGISSGTGPGGSHVLEFQVSGFSTFFLRGNNSSFPVEWLNFEVAQEERDAHLQWDALLDGNGSHFEVERSFDGSFFQNIGTVGMEENARGEESFEFIDQNVADLARTKLYYRLRQIDLDGNYIFSPVRILEWDVFKNVRATLYPNPTRDGVTLRYFLPEETEARVIVSNQLGQLVYENSISSASGERKLYIATDSWPKGMYLVHMTYQQGKISKVLVVE